MQHPLRLTADLGEHPLKRDLEGNYIATIDSAIIPLISMASIACGGHAGDPTTMREAIRLAMEHNVMVGAHPAYPDPEHFGRQSLDMKASDLARSLDTQVSDLVDILAEQRYPLAYIKPHGALYHDVIHKPSVQQVVLDLVKKWQVPLVTLAGAANHALIAKAREAGLIVWQEAFADRRYTDAGLLQPRGEAGAVLHDVSDVLSQAQSIQNDGFVHTSSGRQIPLTADCLCVHGDNPTALSIAQALSALLATHQEGV